MSEYVATWLRVLEQAHVAQGSARDLYVGRAWDLSHIAARRVS